MGDIRIAGSGFSRPIENRSATPKSEDNFVGNRQIAAQQIGNLITGSQPKVHPKSTLAAVIKELNITSTKEGLLRLSNRLTPLEQPPSGLWDRIVRWWNNDQHTDTYAQHIKTTKEHIADLLKHLETPAPQIQTAKTKRTPTNSPKNTPPATPPQTTPRGPTGANPSVLITHAPPGWRPNQS